MSVKEVNKKTENYKNTIYVREKNKISIFNISTIKKYIFFFIIISKINIVHCESDNKKTLILLILLVIIVIIIIVLLIIFFVWCCKKKTDIRRDDNQNNYFEGDNYLERDNPEEIQLRERVMNNYPKGLSDYLKEKLISDVYGKKFELFGTNCPICLEMFEEKKSVIIIGGCLHIFHQKCLSELAEKIDINKSILPQFICPTCRKILFNDIDKIKKCISKFPNFFDDIYTNKKLNKLKHINNLIDSILNENINNSKNNNNIIVVKNFKINEEKNPETDRRIIKDENKDLSYDNEIIIKKKLKKKVDIQNNGEKVDDNKDISNME